MNKHKSNVPRVPHLSIQSSKVFNGSIHQNPGDHMRSLSPMGLENFEDDDEGGETVRMNKPAKIRKKHFEQTQEKVENKQSKPSKSSFNPFTIREDQEDTPRGAAIGKSRVLREKSNTKYQDPGNDKIYGQIFKKMVGSELQLEESTIKSIQIFDSTSKTSSPKRSKQIYTNHLNKREKLFQQKIEQIEK